MKKSIIKCLALLLSVLLCTSAFTACGADSGKPAGEKPAAGEPTKEKAAQKVTLTLLANQDWTNKPYMKAAWKNYEDKTGNKLDIQAVPIDSGEQVMKTKFATGEIPDVFMHFGGNGLDPFQPEKNFFDMSGEKWVSDIKDFALFQVKFKDKIYGLPLWEGTVSGLLYNKEIFTKLNISIPKTQTEFLAACETLKSNNIIPIYMGFKDVWPIFPQFALDSIFKDPDLMGKLNSNQTKYADVKEFNDMLNFYKMLADKGYLGEKFSTNTFDGQARALGEGKYAMCYSWDGFLTTDVEPKYPGTSAKFGIMPSFLGANEEGSYEGPNACMTFACKTGKNAEAAKAFVNFLAEPENLNLAYKGQPTQTYFKSVNTNKPSEQYTEAKDSVDRLMLSSYAWAGIIGFDQVEMVKPIQELMLGSKTVEETARAMDDVRMKSAKAQKAPGF